MIAHGVDSPPAFYFHQPEARTSQIIARVPGSRSCGYRLPGLLKPFEFANLVSGFIANGFRKAKAIHAESSPQIFFEFNGTAARLVFGPQKFLHEVRDGLHNGSSKIVISVRTY